MDFRQQVLEAFGVNLLYGRELLMATPEEQFANVPIANMNHPAWIAGHITLPHRRVAKELGAQVDIPEGWVELFGRGSQPQCDPGAYPPKAELIRAFMEGHEQLAAVYATATPAQLAAPNVRWKPTRISTVGAMAIHAMTTHEALHLGQLSAWRRAMGLPTLNVTGN
jgi:hypothetical protein